MKVMVSLLLLCTIVLISCTDRDDNLEGVQIRVQNTTGTTFTEVVIDSLVFFDMKPDELAFYQKYEGLVLPQNVLLKGDSLELTVAIDTMFEIDSTNLNLFTYKIKGLSADMNAAVEVLKD
jgi:hypothetical protein